MALDFPPPVAKARGRDALRLPQKAPRCYAALSGQKNKPTDYAAGLVASPPPKEVSNKSLFFLRLAERTLSRTPQVSHGTLCP